MAAQITASQTATIGALAWLVAAVFVLIVIGLLVAGGLETERGRERLQALTIGGVSHRGLLPV